MSLKVVGDVSGVFGGCVVVVWCGGCVGGGHVWAVCWECLEASIGPTTATRELLSSN